RSGSRRSVGKISSQGRSCRVLGLLMRIPFTAISSPVAVSGTINDGGPGFFGTGSARDVMTRRHVGRHSKVDLIGGILGDWAPGTKVPPGIGTAVVADQAQGGGQCARPERAAIRLAGVRLRPGGASACGAPRRRARRRWRSQWRGGRGTYTGSMTAAGARGLES